MIEVMWPGRLPNLSGLPSLRITVLTPHDQAKLHRQLARLGYVINLRETRDDRDVWEFVHPDGPN